LIELSQQQVRPTEQERKKSKRSKTRRKRKKNWKKNWTKRKRKREKRKKRIETLPAVIPWRNGGGISEVTPCDHDYLPFCHHHCCVSPD